MICNEVAEYHVGNYTDSTLSIMGLVVTVGNIIDRTSIVLDGNHTDSV